MGSIPLKVGSDPSPALKRYRVKYGGRAQLQHLVGLLVAGAQSTLAGVLFTLKHRPPRDLEAIEQALLVQLADVENALAHARRMIYHRDMPVSNREWTSQDPELVAIVRGEA